MPKRPTECFAERGKTIIDTINPETGLTTINGETLEQCQARLAPRVIERMAIQDFIADRAAGQDAPVTWNQTTREVFDAMLGALPPAAYAANAFLVGEPFDHHAITGAPRFDAFRHKDGQFWSASRPMTRREFARIIKGLDDESSLNKFFLYFEDCEGGMAVHEITIDSRNEEPCDLPTRKIPGGYE